MPPSSDAESVAVAKDAPVQVEPLPAPKPEWIAEHGTTLRAAVEEWSSKAGWTVIWDASIDYPIVGTLRYRGEYLDAVRGIFLAHAHAARPLQADAYVGQKLVHVTE